MPYSKKNQEGFVSVLSILSLGFLVVSLIVGTLVVTKKGGSFDIREFALMSEEVDVAQTVQKDPYVVPTPSKLQTTLEKKSAATQCLIECGTSSGSCFSNCMGITPPPSSAPTTPTAVPGSMRDFREGEEESRKQYEEYKTESRGGTGIVDTTTTSPISTRDFREAEEQIEKDQLIYKGQTSFDEVARTLKNKQTIGNIAGIPGIGTQYTSPTTYNPYTTGQLNSNLSGLNTEKLLTDFGRTLNTVTLGTFGEYVEANQTQGQNYLQRVINKENLAASAKLGTIVTAEGAALVVGGAALTGTLPASIPLSTAVLPAINTASLTAYSYATAAITTTLASAPSWVAPTLSTVKAGMEVGGTTYATIKCIQDPYSPECTGLITGYQTNPIAFQEELTQSVNTLKTNVLNPVANKLVAGGKSLLGLKSPQLGTDNIDNLITYVTGIDPNDPELNKRLIEDVKVIRAKYGLPSREIMHDSPLEFQHQLEEIAQANKVEIIPFYERQRFFEEHPFAGGVYFEKEGLVVKPSKLEGIEGKIDNLRTLEHELIHGLQEYRYPDMPIEGMEYEAYMAGINTKWLEQADFEEIHDYVFGAFRIYGSVYHWYEDANLIAPWMYPQ